MKDTHHQHPSNPPNDPPGERPTRQPDHQRTGPAALKQIETKLSAEQAAASAAIEQLKRNADTVRAFRNQMAKQRHDVFKSYIHAGFTEGQALELLKAEITKQGY
jgi:hypothetical protein